MQNHLLFTSVLGLGFSAILCRLAFPTDALAFQGVILQTIIVTMVTSALLVPIASQGKHPGWIGLLEVALLVFLG